MPLRSLPAVVGSAAKEAGASCFAAIRKGWVKAADQQQTSSSPPHSTGQSATFFCSGSLEGVPFEKVTQQVVRLRMQPGVMSRTPRVSQPTSGEQVVSIGPKSRRPFFTAR